MCNYVYCLTMMTMTPCDYDATFAYICASPPPAFPFAFDLVWYTAIRDSFLCGVTGLYVCTRRARACDSLAAIAIESGLSAFSPPPSLCHFVTQVLLLPPLWGSAGISFSLLPAVRGRSV